MGYKYHEHEQLLPFLNMVEDRKIKPLHLSLEDNDESYQQKEYPPPNLLTIYE